MQKLRYGLVLVLGTMTLSAVDQPTPTATTTQQIGTDYKMIDQRYPTVEYHETDSADLEKNAKKKEKRKRYNDGNFVYGNVRPGTTETALFLDPPMILPALPVAESQVVVIGTIGTGQAHLSENKKNVFSEFTLTVEDVFKSEISGVVKGSVLTIDRVGGHVKYPNGQIVLYRMAGKNVPQTGGRYLLFLTSIHNQEDLSILMAYELTEYGAVFLDEPSQATGPTRVAVDEITKRVRALVQHPPK